MRQDAADTRDIFCTCLVTLLYDNQPMLAVRSFFPVSGHANVQHDTMLRSKNALRWPSGFRDSTPGLRGGLQQNAPWSH